MAKTIQQILGASNMIGVSQAVRRGLPQYLPEQFTRVSRRVVGNTCKFNKVSGNRDLAKQVQYGSPAALVNRKGVTQTQATLAHSFESMNHDPLVLQNLMRLDDDSVQQMATDEIDRQSAEFTVRTENFRKGLLYSTIANGKIWFDGNGDQLFSSSGAVTTVDFGVPANNIGQVNSTLGTSWNSASADIIGNITAIKKLAVQTTGYELKHAFYGSSLVNYISGNTKAKELINNTPSLASQLYNTGELPNGFMGLQWHPVYSSFGTTGAGVVTDYFDADYLGLFPEPSPEWWECVEGSYIVPKSVDVTSGVAAAVSNMQTVFGMFDYAKVSDNPVTIQHFHGDTFLPLLKVPGAVFLVDTKF